MAEEWGKADPRGESLLTATKAAWALASLLVKWGVVKTEGVNQYPSQRTSSWGAKIQPSRWTGEQDTGPLSLIVLLWISFLCGMEKLTPKRPPWPSTPRSASVSTVCCADKT